MGRPDDGIRGTERGPGRSSQGLLTEFVLFLGHSKKWWLVPILLALLVLGLVVVLGSTAAGPFIYTLF